MYLKIFLGGCLLLSVLAGCKKADHFFEKENNYPQIDNAYAYRPAYLVGDTLEIIGRLLQNKDLQVSVGGVTGQIVQKTTYRDEDQVGILITASMVGKAQAVTVSSAGYTTTGTPIDVYTPGGEGSFSNSLHNVQLGLLLNAYHFLYAVTGKGDVYYYDPAGHALRQVRKDGSTTTLYDLSGLDVATFLAGGVDPQAQHLYFSVQHTSGYSLYELDLQNKNLLTLNTSAGLAAPYEGKLADVQMIVSGIYPDAQGNLYLGTGNGNGQTPNFVPDAIAQYRVSDGGVHYIFKDLNYLVTYPGMPGVKIPTTNVLSVRFSPAENLLYAMVKTNGLTQQVGIQLFNLDVGIKLQDLEPGGSSAGYNVLAPFSGLNINLGTSMQANQVFGYLPMPHQRLQTLLYQSIGTSLQEATQLGFPRWTVFDFANKRTYAYAPGLFPLGSNPLYAFRDNDELLNYDESGNLYMTANGKSYLLRTAAN